MNDYSAATAMICESSWQFSFFSNEAELLDVSFCGLVLCEGQKGIYLIQKYEARRELMPQGRP